MKLAARPYELEGDLEGEVIDFDFDPGSLVHLMNQYIDLYKDKEMAVIREYACNALDSHVAAGNKAPIEVTLPTGEDPTLLIQDYGLGLGYKEIRDIFTKYGASTKRDSNEYTGALGLGCKAGLTYAPQFTMTAVKDGLRNVTLISRGPMGARLIIVERDAEVDEPNGVLLQIPCNHHNTFAPKASKLFQYWEEGTVLVNGEQPSRFEGRMIVENLYLRIRRDKYFPQHVVIMGGVAYPFDASLLGWEIGHEHDVVAFVPIGTLEFPPDREGLRDTKGNKAALFRIGQTLITEMQKTAQADIDGAENPVVAIRRAYNWNRQLPEKARPKVWTYKGAEMPIYFEAPTIKDEDDLTIQTRWTLVKEKSTKLSAHDRMDKTPFATAINAIWFHGFDVKFSANHRKRLDMWHETGYPGSSVAKPEHYILCAEKPDMTYLKDDQVFDWETVRSIRLPSYRSGGSGSGRLIGSYDAYKPGISYAYETLASEIDQGEAVFYYAANQPKFKHDPKRETQARPWVELLRHYDPNATVVLLPETRLRKFLEQFPDAEDIRPAVRGKFNRWKSRLTPDQRKALAIHQSGVRDQFEGLDPVKIHDPDIRETLDLVKLNLKKVLSQYERFAKIGKHLELPEWTNPLRHYPLMEDSYRYRRVRAEHPEHVHAYLNSAYRLRLDPEAL